MRGGDRGEKTSNFYSILFYSTTLLYSTLLHSSIPSYSIQFHSILFYFLQFNSSQVFSSLLFTSLLFSSILFSSPISPLLFNADPPSLNILVHIYFTHFLPDNTIECLSTLLASEYWEVKGIKVFKDFLTRRDITIEFVAFLNCIIPRDDLIYGKEEKK